MVKGSKPIGQRLDAARAALRRSEARAEAAGAALAATQERHAKAEDERQHKARELQELEAQGRHAGAALDKDRWLMRLGLPPAQAQALMGEACLHGIRLNLAAVIGQGLGWADADDLPAHRISSLSERCRSLGGELNLVQQPQSSSLTSGTERANHNLVAAIKREFDPLQQLARGRLPGL